MWIAIALVGGFLVGLLVAEFFSVRSERELLRRLRDDFTNG